MLTDELQHILLNEAMKSIQHGLQYDIPMEIDIVHYPEPLQSHKASFVSLFRQQLTVNRGLRGCIGTLRAYQPLITDIIQNAFRAAFHDPRFKPLGYDEIEDLNIHISILSNPELMTFSSEEDLKKQIRPGKDGLILEAAGHRGTFLPSVWESIPTVEEFVKRLKNKAGLPENYWSDDVKVYRYRTFVFHSSSS